MQPAGYSAGSTTTGWLQYEPVQAAATVTTTNATPQLASGLTNGSGIPVLNFTSSTGLVRIYLNAVWTGSASLGDMQACWLDTNSSNAVVSGSLAAVSSGNRRIRTGHNCVVSVTPGVAQAYALGLAGDGTHAGGVTIGTDYHLLAYVLDLGVSIKSNCFIKSSGSADAYREHSSPGGAISGASLTSTTLQQFQLESAGGAINLPQFTALASDLTLIRMSGQMADATASGVDTALGLWDNDAAAALAGSTAAMCGGDVSSRVNPSYAKIITGLASATKNLSVACKLETAGTNTVVLKVGADNVEGPWVMEAIALGA